MCLSPWMDFKGMRIRSLGQQGKAMAKLGAVPTSVPAPEVYTSLDRGLLDAAGFAYYAHNPTGRSNSATGSPAAWLSAPSPAVL